MEYAESWRESQVHRVTSAAHVEGMLRRHAYPTFGSRQISTILPSDVQAWVKVLGTSDRRVGRKALAPATVAVVHSLVSAVMRAAARDRKIMANPCEGTRLPTKEHTPVIPLTTEQVERVREAMPDELQALSRHQPLAPVLSRHRDEPIAP
jgi:hypothetical protein